MATTAIIDAKDEGLLGTVRGLLASILNLESIRAVLVPRRLPAETHVMPALITDPQKLAEADPLAPFFPMNAAKLVSKLTRKPMGGIIAVVLRSCEIRALIELVKLHQVRMEEILILGIDCLGAFSNKDYRHYAGGCEDADQASLSFCSSMLSMQSNFPEGLDIQPACKACVKPLAQGADLSIGLIGIDFHKHIYITGQTEKGVAILENLELTMVAEPPQREPAVAAFLESRSDYRKTMFQETGAAVDGIEKLSAYLSDCINCYNCRVACPVCYCRECVFVTDVFDHDPSQYLRWAERKGVIKMPTDTVFYHLTRLAHMSTACVGCGQCSNACPNDIPVMELFQTVAADTQRAFGYEAGKSVADAPPLSEFREEEFEEVVGI